MEGQGKHRNKKFLGKVGKCITINFYIYKGNNGGGSGIIKIPCYALHFNNSLVKTFGQKPKEAIK
jgi:hypothetical protein